MMQETDYQFTLTLKYVEKVVESWRETERLYDEKIFSQGESFPKGFKGF